MKPYIIAADGGALDYLISSVSLSSSADVSGFAAARSMLSTQKIERAFLGCYGLNLNNWDGDGAVAISHDCLKSAEDFVREIVKAGYDLPDIAPSADGSIGMEWWHGEACVFVDVGPEKITRIYYNPSNGGKYSEEPISWSMGSETIVMKALALLKKLFPLKDARTATAQLMMTVGFGSSHLGKSYDRPPQQVGNTSFTTAPLPNSSLPTWGLIGIRPSYQDEFDQKQEQSSKFYPTAKNLPRIELVDLQA